MTNHPCSGACHCTGRCQQPATLLTKSDMDKMWQGVIKRMLNKVKPLTETEVNEGWQRIQSSLNEWPGHEWHGSETMD